MEVSNIEAVVSLFIRLVMLTTRFVHLRGTVKSPYIIRLTKTFFSEWLTNINS